MPRAFDYDRFALRLSRLSILSRTFRFYDERRQLIAFAKITDYRVLASIDLFADEARQRPLLWMRERAPGYPPTWDLIDPLTGHRIGAVRQRPWKSLFKDEWTLLDTSEREMGCVKQGSLLMALIRHFLLFVPTRYDVYQHEVRVGTCRQSANPLMPSMTFDFTADPEKRFDRRFAPAVAVLLLEHRKHDE